MVKTGPIDMIIKYGNTLIPVDVKVKMWNYKKGLWYAPGSANIEGLVWGLAVDPSDKSVSWYKVHGGNQKLNNYQCPPGFEDFWE